MKSVLLTAALLLATSAALADEATPPAETIAPPTCKKPLMPSKVRAADDTSEFQEKFDHYRDCIKAYADAQSEASKAHILAANAAIKDLNDFATEVNNSQQK